MIRRSVLVAALLLPSACGEAEQTPAPSATEQAEPLTAPAAPEPAPPALPVQLDAPLPGPDEEEPQPLLRYWKQAVEGGERANARRAWRSEVRGGGTAPRWANLSNVQVTFGEGRIEDAAGSSYYEVPVAVKGTGVDGSYQTLEGTMRLRRVNDVPGAGPEQLSWRIESIDWRG
jgi:hypothetical protein